MNRLRFSIPLPTFSRFTISIFLFFFSFSAAAQCGCTDCRCSDSLELVALYNSTNGANWTNKWVLTQPMTTWYGITLTNGRVTAIALFSNQLSGNIPNFNLPNLQDLYLQSNQLSGSIPNFNLPNLQSLNLGVNQLSGNIPNFNLSNLQYLNLSNNQLSGSIPNFNLPNLQNLSLWSNQLSGNIPNFNLPNLVSLVLSSNQLSGSIPNFNLPNLQSVSLSYNRLSGVIPNFNLPNLVSVSLEKNRLSGNIPNFNLPNLQNLFLWSNQLSGIIPDFNLPKLQVLWLYENRLNGNIPNLNLLNLIDLRLNDNLLSGNIPNFNLPNLQRLTLENNQLSGNIPNFNLPKLANLMVNNNKLNKVPDLTYIRTWVNGFVYSGIGYLGSLRLHNNYLTFSDILPNIPILLTSTFSFYAPQDSIFKDTTYQTTEGGNLTINLGIDDTVTTNIYKWYKNNVFVDSIVGNNKRIFTNLRLTDAGVWTCRVTNPNAPLLTLYSRKATVVVAQSCRSRDSLALVALYNATGGPNWTRRDNWLTSSPISTWYGIQTDMNGCVTCIDLDGNPNDCGVEFRGNNMVGNLPPEIGNFSELESLVIAYNVGLKGSIPKEVGNLLKLKTLTLSDNRLSGNIPSEIGNLTNLDGLYLYGNRELTGTIPSTIRNLQKLRNLTLYGNKLQGNIPNEINELANLGSISLSSNQFNGKIPTLNLPRLQILFLNNNQLSDTIPNFNLPKLLYFNLNDNQLTGNVPNFNFSELEIFHIHNNKIDNCPHFTNFPSLKKDTTYWRGLRNYGNKLTFEDIISNMSFVTTASFIYTPQDSIFKDTTYQLTEGGNLTINLGIDDTVTTNVYKWYKNGTLYQTINGNNKLTFNNIQLTDAGVYTCQVTNPNAPLLTLYSRKATVVVAQSCRSRDSLALVALYNATGGPNWTRRDNWLTSSPISTWYGIQTDANGCVTCIDLDGNVNCSNDGVVGVGNKLSGIIPDSIKFLTNLTNLCLSQNKKLTGTIPSSIGNLTNLKILGLNSDSLTGNIPATIGNLSQLWQLALYENSLSGNIPTELGNLTNLIHLQLNQNKLTGNIPISLGSLTKCVTFLLSENRLDGSIPVVIGNLTNLSTLSLRSNQLSGPIPPELGRLTKMNSLWLESNQLTGTIPNELASMTQLEYLTIGFNNLSGEVPAYLANFGLKALYLTRNKFTKIPNLSNITTWDYTFTGGTHTGKGLKTEGNRLTFESILPNMNIFNTGNQSFYAPQDSIFKDTTYNLTSGSTLTIDLGIDNALTTNKYVWFKNGIRFDSSNVNKLILKGLMPCDAATYTVQVTNPAAPLLTLYSRKAKVVVTGSVPTPSVDTTICNNKSYRLPSGRIVTIAGTYTDTLRNIRNCDSLIITTRLTISPKADSIKQTPVLCNGQTYTLPNGQIVNTTTNYRDTARTLNGCDSLIRIINITTGSNPTTITLSANICRGQSYTLPNGQIVTPSVNTTYLDTLKSQSGCDSLRRTTIVNVSAPTVLAAQNAAICSGQSYTLPSGRIVSPSATTTFNDTIRGRTGCDSLIRAVNLTVNQPTERPLSISICSGQNHTLPKGRIVSISGIYRDTFRTIGGCDSVVVTTLTVNPASETPLSFTICTGQTHRLPSNRLVSVSGIYRDTFKNAQGCNTIIVTTLTVTSPIVTPLSINLFEGDSFRFKGRIVRNSGIYRDSFRTVGGCDSIVEINLSFKPIVIDESCLNEIKNAIPNAFSPNDDGTNEVFDPTLYFSVAGCPPNLKAERLIIVNQWGEIIWEANPYRAWDGHSGKHQKPVPESAYFYVLVLRVNGKERMIRGAINVFTDK